MQSGKPLVWIIAHPEGDAEGHLETQRRQAIARIERDGWECRTRRTYAAKTVARRSVYLLQPYDAHDLYQSVHRRTVAVLQMAPTRVLLDPMGLPYPRNTINLERFVRYKAFFGYLNVRVSIDEGVAQFAQWTARRTCSGERDARCLPLHVISPSHDWSYLDQEEGVRAFEACHGTPTNRVDEDQRRWNAPNACHGREALSVAGADLRSGFHWDVVSPRSAGRLCTSHEVWKFSRGAYINVYPDGAAREGQRAALSAKRVYLASRPSPIVDVPSQPSPTKRKHRW